MPKSLLQLLYVVYYQVKHIFKAGNKTKIGTAQACSSYWQHQRSSTSEIQIYVDFWRRAVPQSSRFLLHMHVHYIIDNKKKTVPATLFLNPKLHPNKKILPITVYLDKLITWSESINCQ